MDSKEINNLNPPGWDELVTYICDNMVGVTPSTIFSKSRKTEVVLARRMFCNLASRSVCRNMSQEKILYHMGPKWPDRSILSYYEKCHRDQWKVNKKYKIQFKKIIHILED
jgi:hypothetical protein